MQQKQLIYLRIITTTFLILGGIAWGIIGAVGFNPLTRFFRAINMRFMSRILYGMIGVSAALYIYLFYNRNTFLPFLSEAVFPTGLIAQIHPNDYDHEITLDAPKNANMIIYWAAESSDEIQSNPKEAYGKYENAGASAVKDGKVVVHIKKPAAYKLPGKVNEAHIHYRWVFSHGMTSDVNTLYL